MDLVDLLLREPRLLREPIMVLLDPGVKEACPVHGGQDTVRAEGGEEWDGPLEEGSGRTRSAGRQEQT